MSRPRTTTVAAVALFAGLLGSCADNSGSPGTSEGSPSPTPAPSSAAPSLVGELSHVEPGRHDVAFLFGDGSMHAVVDVPQGYFTGPDFAVIDDGDDVLAPNEYGDLAFWAHVDKVDTDPCYGGNVVSAGTTVQDLVDVFLARKHWRTSAPEPTSIGGYDGVYLVSHRPASIASCPREEELIQMARGDDGPVWLTSFGYDTVFHSWILDVDGQRVVAGARIAPGRTSEPQELLDMVESAEIVTTGKQ